MFDFYGIADYISPLVFTFGMLMLLKKMECYHNFFCFLLLSLIFIAFQDFSLFGSATSTGV